MGKPPFIWQWDRKYDLAVALIPKCGLNSIRAWLSRDCVQVLQGDERLSTISKRIAFIRNPIDRLVSAYSFFYWMQDYGSKSYKDIPLDSWESFVDHVLNPEVKDEHWQPQIEIIDGVANTYHRFEEILHHYGKYRPGIFPHRNISSRLSVNAYRLQDICKKYERDFDLWLRID